GGEFAPRVRVAVLAEPLPVLAPALLRGHHALEDEAHGRVVAVDGDLPLLSPRRLTRELEGAVGGWGGVELARDDRRPLRRGQHAGEVLLHPLELAVVVPGAVGRTVVYLDVADRPALHRLP